MRQPELEFTFLCCYGISFYLIGHSCTCIHILRFIAVFALWTTRYSFLLTMSLRNQRQPIYNTILHFTNY